MISPRYPSFKMILVEKYTKLKHITVYLRKDCGLVFRTTVHIAENVRY